MSSATTSSVSQFTTQQADSIIESLRMGVPPVGFLRQFTVGRQEQLARLTRHFDPDAKPESLLVQANYGAGKTHLLRLLREVALDAGYAVALVTVDSRSRVRFNRMDQVIGAVMRALEVPSSPTKGVGSLFDLFHSIDVEILPTRQQMEHNLVTDRDRWSMSGQLKCAPLWVALRAWRYSRAPDVEGLIADWLTSSWDYKTKRALLYNALVRQLPHSVREPRSEEDFYKAQLFSFDARMHEPAWDALHDLHMLARMSGLKGLVLLFDEFEDVIQNMNNIGFERAAFTNLLKLFQHETFGGSAYFAVTPEFTLRCRLRLMEKMQWDYPVERFDELERIEMTPVTATDFRPLATLVRDLHGKAYDWDSKAVFTSRKLDSLVKQLFRQPQADQVRQAIIGLVTTLDRALDE